MRGRTGVVSIHVVGVALLLSLAACGGSSKAVTGGDAPLASGNAVLQGAVAGAGEGARVVAIGTPAAAAIDEDGRFVLSSLPAGTANLRFEGGGANATLAVPGLQDGLVATINVTLAGSTAQLAGGVNCTPSADTFFSGLIEQMSGTNLVVAGRRVDASQNKKVWRGDRRIELSALSVGEKVKVWGVLRGDGVVVSEEIVALTTGPGGEGETWTSFTGRVESVSSSSRAAGGVHYNPNVPTSYPTVVVAGRIVHTNDQTKFRWSDGSTLDPRDIKAGQTAQVEGWKKADGSIRATGFGIDGTNPAGAFVSFRGRVDSLSASSTGDVVHANPYATPSFTIAGRKVRTDGSTAFKWSDGSWLDAAKIVVGDQATVEGWTKPEGYVLATRIVVDKR